MHSYKTAGETWGSSGSGSSDRQRGGVLGSDSPEAVRRARYARRRRGQPGADCDAELTWRDVASERVTIGHTDVRLNYGTS